MKRRRLQSGAALTEYALILGIVVPVFIIIGLLLKASAMRGAENSANAVNAGAPCGNKSALTANTEECM